MVRSPLAVIQFKVEFTGKGLKENIRLNVEGIVSPTYQTALCCLLECLFNFFIVKEQTNHVIVSSRHRA